MKAIITIIFFLLHTFPFMTMGQPQKNVDRQRELNFTVSLELITDTSRARDLFNLIISADRKSIKGAERVYVRVIDRETEKDLFVRAINKEVLKGEKSNRDESIKTAFIDKDKVELNVGSFERGDYYVFIKIRDEKDNVYFDRKKVSL